MTTGLVDPATSLWGQRTTKFAKQTWNAPRIDLDRLEEESNLGEWAARRLVPKALLATQTKVLEVAVDTEGTWLPCVPLITITADGDQVWLIAAALMSPPVTAWASSQYAGSGMTMGALKLSASQVAELPAPDPGTAWDYAAGLVKAAAMEPDRQDRLALLVEAGERMCSAYGVEAEQILPWWADRLGAAR